MFVQSAQPKFTDPRCVDHGRLIIQADQRRLGGCVAAFVMAVTDSADAQRQLGLYRSQQRRLAHA